MKNSLFIPVALLIAGLAGCSKNHANQASMNQQNASASKSDDELKNVTFTARTHYAAGLLAESRGDFTNAITHFKSATIADPSFNLALFRLGCAYSEAQRYPESVAIWHKYIKATNNSAGGYSNLAFTEELAGNPNGAEADYKLGVTADPTNEACRVNYGLMLARHGRVGEAVIQLQAVLPPAQVKYNIATVYELQHRSEQAKIEYQEALALDPNFSDARDRLASLGDYADRE